MTRRERINGVSGQERFQETVIERDEKREFAPVLLLSLAWQSASWQGLRYPLQMGNPADAENEQS